MTKLLGTVALAAFAFSTAGGSAQAGNLCRLTGTYNDEYGIATANIKGMKGQLVAPEVCATPYNFKISNETVNGFDVKGGNTTKSCGSFKTTATFQGSCSAFSVSGTIKGMQFSDQFTRQAKARGPQSAPELSLGFK